MPERFEGEERAFYEWIVSGEANIVPDELSLDRGQSDNEADGSKKKITRPLLAAISHKARAKTGARRPLSRNLAHEQGYEREAASLNERASSRFAREDARKFSELQ